MCILKKILKKTLFLNIEKYGKYWKKIFFLCDSLNIYYIYIIWFILENSSYITELLIFILCRFFA